MADQLQLRGGSTTEHSTFTGALREVTVDITKKTLVVHDATTVGGIPIAREDLSNVDPNSIAAAVPAGTTLVAGVLQLTDSTSSTSITTAATPNSVKSAFDLASAALAPADIGVTVQGFDPDILTTSDIGVNVQAYDPDLLTDSDIGVTVQGYDVETAKLDVAQTFTAVQTLTDPAIIGTILEDVFTITDGADFEVDPANGSVQLITLGANRTPKATNFAAGHSITLMVDDGTAHTLTWTDTTWGTSGVEWTGGAAPDLATTGYTVLQFWKVSTQVYGALVGEVA
jgi:hypothetical protein